MRHSETLSARQVAAIARLMAGDNVTATAAAVGINRRTVARWMGDPRFIAALRSARGDAIGQAARRTAGALDRMAQIVIDLAERSEDDAVRLRAALAVLAMHADLMDLGEMDDRLRQLEAATGGDAWPAQVFDHGRAIAALEGRALPALEDGEA